MYIYDDEIKRNHKFDSSIAKKSKPVIVNIKNVKIVEKIDKQGPIKVHVKVKKGKYNYNKTKLIIKKVEEIDSQKTTSTTKITTNIEEIDSNKIDTIEKPEVPKIPPVKLNANIKQFVVDDNCVACGLCFTAFPDLISENVLGGALSNKSVYITKNNLAEAKKVIAICPVKTLSLMGIRTHSISELQNKLNNAKEISIFYKQTYIDISFNYKDYYSREELSWSSLGDDKYFKKSKDAKNYLLDRYDRFHTRQIKNIVSQVVSKYCADKLSKYHIQNEDNIFIIDLAKYQELLQEIYGQAMALSGSKIKLPQDFSEINFENIDNYNFSNALSRISNIHSKCSVSRVKSESAYYTNNLPYINIETDYSRKESKRNAYYYDAYQLEKDIYEANQEIAEAVMYDDFLDYIRDSIELLVKGYKEWLDKTLNSKIEILNNAITNLK